ncbi:hypothetical protein [Rurimicrobium arvi]|uniref:Transglycosylase SLT domain-containing protein n=1 Tax=Rurimicrobium arvi TaxID=2049916 RepID=A0ABP8MZE9_9BACT
MALIHIDHPNIPPSIRAAFGRKVEQIAAWLIIDPNWLMQVMYAESRLKPTAQNIQNGRVVAAGLLQWTKASGVPGAPQSLLRYDHLQQLDFVKTYFAPYRGRMKSYFDVYLVTFFPAAVGQPDDYVFSTAKLSASLVAAQNPAINKVKDGRITMAEFKQYVWDSTPDAVRGLVFKARQVYEDVKSEVQRITEDGNGQSIAKAAGGIATIIAFFFSSAI